MNRTSFEYVLNKICSAQWYTEVGPNLVQIRSFSIINQNTYHEQRIRYKLIAIKIVTI